MPKGRGSHHKAARTALTDKERLFVEAYLETQNAAEAARRSYTFAPTTSKESVSGFAAKVLKRPLVKAAVDAAIERKRRKFEIKADRVIAEAALIAFADIGEIAEWDENGVRVRPSAELTRDQRAMISEVVETTDASGKTTVRVKLHSKLQAVELLGKNLKLWGDASINLLVANLSAMPDDQIERRAMELLARAAEKAKAIDVAHQPVHVADGSHGPAAGGASEPRQGGEDRVGPPAGGTEGAAEPDHDPQLPAVSEAG